MRKAIVALAAIGAIVGLRAVIRRKAEKMREHCKQMAAKCKQMMSQSEAHAEEVGVPQDGEPMAEPAGDRREAVAA